MGVIGKAALETSQITAVNGGVRLIRPKKGKLQLYEAPRIQKQSPRGFGGQNTQKSTASYSSFFLESPEASLKSARYSTLVLPMRLFTPGKWEKRRSTRPMDTYLADAFSKKFRWSKYALRHQTHFDLKEQQRPLKSNGSYEDKLNCVIAAKAHGQKH